MTVNKICVGPFIFAEINLSTIKEDYYEEIYSST